MGTIGGNVLATNLRCGESEVLKFHCPKQWMSSPRWKPRRQLPSTNSNKVLSIRPDLLN